VVQYNEYSPLGLQASTSWTRENSSNNFLYNEGSELNQTTGWYETAFRNYDAALGRLTSIDPMASKYASFSGYHYAYNNPVMSNDPSGADAESDAQTQAQTQFNYMLEMEKLQRELEDKQWADFLASNPGYDGPRDLGLVAQYYGMQAEAAQQKEAALLAAAQRGDMNAVREYAAMHGGLIRYEGAAAKTFFTRLYAMEEARVAQQGGAQQRGPYGGLTTDFNALKQYLAIVAGESSNNMNEAAAIGSVILNRLVRKGTNLKGNFIDKIGGKGQFDAIDGSIYNEIMSLSESDIRYLIKNAWSLKGKYSQRIIGAMAPLLINVDYSNGAYFWNATSQGFKRKMGPNFDAYCSGIYESTGIIGDTSFFRYYDQTKKWP